MAGLIGSDKWIEDLKEKFPKQTFSARIANNGTATVTSVDHDFIESVSRNSTGNVTVTFKSGIFTVTPSSTATAINVGYNVFPTILTESSTSITIGTTNESGGVIDRGFNLVVKKQGADAE